MRTRRPNLAMAICTAIGCALIALAGCRPFDHYHAPAQPPIPSVQAPPTEKDRISLPAYRIEPPDLVQLEVLKLVPRPPYHLEAYDVLMIQVIGTLLDQPIDGYYLIDADGTISLGAAYGTLRIVGLTIEQAKEAVAQHLRTILAQPEVSLTLARTSGTAMVSGIYLVGNDGTINLRQYGAVHVAGKTLVEARIAIESQLSLFFDSPQVSIDIAGYNSKVYYVITEGAGLGDSSLRLPITGNETVLDAISQMGGMSRLSSRTVFVVRPGPAGMGCEQILPVDWVAVSHGSTATNYQLLPGDRVYVVEDPLVAGSIGLGKVTGPLEQLLGLTGLGSSVIRATQTLGRSFNRFRN